MKTRLITTVIIVGIITLAVWVALSFLPENEKAVFNQEAEAETEAVNVLITVDAPETCAVGDMVELDASKSTASAFKWMVIPQTKNFKVIEDGRRALFCSGTPGLYLFVVAAADGTGTLSIMKIEVIVDETSSPLPRPENVFTITVRGWLPAKPDPLILEKLARSFERVASAGHTEVAVLVKTTALSNRGILGPSLTAWTPFLKEFSAHLKTNFKDEPIEKHVELWFSLASILRSLK